MYLLYITPTIHAHGYQSHVDMITKGGALRLDDPITAMTVRAVISPSTGLDLNEIYTSLASAESQD